MRIRGKAMFGSPPFSSFVGGAHELAVRWFRFFFLENCLASRRYWRPARGPERSSDPASDAVAPTSCVRLHFPALAPRPQVSFFPGSEPADFACGTFQALFVDCLRNCFVSVVCLLLCLCVKALSALVACWFDLFAKTAVLRDGDWPSLTLTPHPAQPRDKRYFC